MTEHDDLWSESAREEVKDIHSLSDIICGEDAEGLVCHLPKNHGGMHEAHLVGDVDEFMSRPNVVYNPPTFNQWIEMGVGLGYCSPQYCQTHDATPMHPSEEAAWEAGSDPCCHVVRLGVESDWDVGEC